MTINFDLIQIGDRLIRTKGGVLTKHHALYMGYQDNQYWVAENQNGYGVRYITLNQFLNEGELEDVRYNNFSTDSQNVIINRVNNRIGTPYILFTYNCEHFVNEILTGIAESKQVQVGIALGIGFVGVCALAYWASNKNKQTLKAAA